MIAVNRRTGTGPRAHLLVRFDRSSVCDHRLQTEAFGRALLLLCCGRSQCFASYLKPIDQLPLLVALLDALRRRAERLAACLTHVILVAALVTTGTGVGWCVGRSTANSSSTLRPGVAVNLSARPLRRHRNSPDQACLLISSWKSRTTHRLTSLCATSRQAGPSSING